MTRRGYRQTPEHVAKRIKSGPDHWNWAGDEISRRGGRARALRQYPSRPCEECGAEKRARTKCKRNHLLSGTNLYVAPDGKRVRKECRKLTSRRHRQSRKQG